jgi:hypothetical protein
VRLRMQRLSAVVAWWLVVQVIVTASVSVCLCLQGTHATSHTDMTDCVGMGPNHVCPMHQQVRDTDGGLHTQAVWKADCSNREVLLAGLSIGVLAHDVATFTAPQLGSGSFDQVFPSTLARAFLPDPFPPKSHSATSS